MAPYKANDDFLIAEAHAKINLHLEVLGIRSDGFHELAMVMQSINLSDQLKMIKRVDNTINLKSNNKDEWDQHTTVYRPWGKFESIEKPVTLIVTSLRSFHEPWFHV